ncbi:conserved hypothetical protein [Uncinocarpus reesii 1704]|uniref:J domain-containing protein n=1 Tax=Uncinocarpus reesii (strain UAMH 1704) TaxID=336963 RepID=C4JXQ8_UNCRE|nr:uncharacterized protein UREG_07846 [Uncinocarpus reesii 1704]EEP82981.1 conserved hypothetical protein [Uncinocarpus reesii 1704]
MADSVDYYKVLEVDPSATQQQIRDAYKRSPETPRVRRRTPHLVLCKSHRGTNAHPPPQSESFSSDQFGSMFEEMLREESMAADAAEAAGGYFWSVLGGLSGGAIGFIVANFPGAVAGAVAGNRLGAVRDKKGKSVYQVFQELPQEDKAKLLSRLAARVLQSAETLKILNGWSENSSMTKQSVEMSPGAAACNQTQSSFRSHAVTPTSTSAWNVSLPDVPRASRSGRDWHFILLLRFASPLIQTWLAIPHWTPTTVDIVG